jgi:hypothetical protein
MDAIAPRSVVTRAIGAAMLDIDTYEEGHRGRVRRGWSRAS